MLTRSLAGETPETVVGKTFIFKKLTDTARRIARALTLGLCAGFALSTAPGSFAQDTKMAPKPGPTTLRVVTYSHGADFYRPFADEFRKAQAGSDVVLASGQSNRMVEAVLTGDEANIVAMSGIGELAPLVNAKLLPEDWIKASPNNSVPFTSIISFMVRKGNPRGVKDWADLARPGVAVIVASPLSSGTGRYTYLSAWYSQLKAGKSEAEARKFVSTIFTANASVTGGGRRGSSSVFQETASLDVLLTYESEILRIMEKNPGKYEIVRPSLSVLCEFPVVAVEKHTAKHQNAPLAAAFIAQLYTPDAQRLAAKFGYRSILPDVAKDFAANFPPQETFRAEQVFGPWPEIMSKHFSPGGEYEKMLGL
ncbi:hypothetical protein DB346_19540 [Verrucomicrobia bacterium LW23]|nr:hypothetical protein DB346_19540 [Verrucomicrobia bacterium LW23]